MQHSVGSLNCLIVFSFTCIDAADVGDRLGCVYMIDAERVLLNSQCTFSLRNCFFILALMLIYYSKLMDYRNNLNMIDSECLLIYSQCSFKLNNCLIVLTQLVNHETNL